MSKVLYIHRSEYSNMSAEDKAALRILLEEYGSDVLSSMLNEGYFSTSDIQKSDGQTLGSRSDFETKWNNNPDKNNNSFGTQLKNTARGFVKSLPSIALTMAVCWPAGVMLTLGAWHEKFEKKINNTLLNSKTYLDWIANTSHDKVDKEKAKDASSKFDVAPIDTSTKKSTDKDDDTSSPTKVRKKTDTPVPVIEPTMSPYYAVLNNGEVMKVYALSEEEAKKQVNVIVSGTRGKYSTMNEMFEEGAHTYRAILDDGSIVYLTAETRDKAIAIANATAGELKKFYKSVGVKSPAIGKVKSITDEGIIAIPIPKSITELQKGTAPDPNSVYRLKPEQVKDFYTNKQAKTFTYKLRINYNTVFLCAANDNEAKAMAMKLNKEISGYKGSVLSFLTGSLSGKAWAVTMQDGDRYIICEVPGGDDPKTKALKMIDGKFKLMEKYGGPNVKSVLNTHRDTASNPTVKVASAKSIDIPKKFKNLNAIVLTKVENGVEQEIYKSTLAKEDTEEKGKTLIVKRTIS